MDPERFQSVGVFLPFGLQRNVFLDSSCVDYTKVSAKVKFFVDFFEKICIIKLMTRYMTQPIDSNLCVPISFFNLLLWAGYKKWKGYPVNKKLAKETLPKIFNTDSEGTNFYDYISIFTIKSGKLRLIKNWDYFLTRYREFKQLLSHKNYCALIGAEYNNGCHMFMIESFTLQGKFKCINLFNGITVDYIHSKTVARWFRKRKVFEVYIFEKTQ